MKDKEFPSKIRYYYKLDPHANLFKTHGVWGGHNSQGEIEINFYIESEKLPEFTEQIVAPDGTLDHELYLERDEKEVIRTIHSRVLLDYRTARAFMEWLEEKINDLETEFSRDVYDPNAGIEQ
ncbi:MAG: hypothetical protein IJS54_00880 [Desulfovibrio sp.]|nr:hypothetical protein [Desulfovibrio sp.]